MKFGCVIPNRGELATPVNLRRMAIVAEAQEYDSLWVSDHIVIPTEYALLYPYSESGELPFSVDSPYCEALTTLSYLAGCTHKIKLGTHVLVLPYRNPILTAKMVATLDYLCGGRFLLGIGAGWMEEEFLALGQPHFDRRGAVTDEYIRIFKELWTKKSPEFRGEFYEISGIKLEPKPVQKPHPPIWVGGHSGPAVRRAATLGDAWLPIGLRGAAGLDPQELREKVARLRSIAQRAGRDPEAVAVCFSTNVSISDSPLAGDRRLLTGSPEQIARDIEAYERSGVDYFLFTFRTGSLNELLESIERFAKDVRPLVIV